MKELEYLRKLQRAKVEKPTPFKCPFCGGIRIYRVTHSDVVVCKDCHRSFPRGLLDEGS